MKTCFLWSIFLYIQTNLSFQSHHAFSKMRCLDVHTNLHLSIICRCKHSSSALVTLPWWKMKRPLQLEEQVLCGLPEVVQHRVIGEPQHVWEQNSLCVISAQPVGWRAISQALWINLWQDLSRIKQNWMFNLTCPRAESSLVINQDREDWIWPTLG